MSFFLAAHKSNNTKANSSTGYVSENQMDFPSVAFAGMSFFFFFATQFIEQIEKKRKRNLFLNFKTKSQKGLSQNCFSLRIIFDIKKEELETIEDQRSLFSKDSNYENKKTKEKRKSFS